MNPPSVDVKDMLQAAGLGLVFKNNLFIASEPDMPNTCVTIYDTPGFPPDLTMGDGENYYRPSIQIIVRAIEYLQAYALIHSVMLELHGLAHETWNASTYELIRCAQEPFLLDTDDRNRHRFVCNFNIQRKE